MNSFAQLVGQNQAVELLTQAIASSRIAPAYLFAGADGVGRSLAARCFIEQLFCLNLLESKQQQIHHRLQLGNHPDLLWIQPTYLHQGNLLSAAEAAAAGVKRKAPPTIRIEQIREITQFLSRSPLEAIRSIVVIEQAEAMAEAAANALLKTLEEPGQATLILIAPGTEALLPTLVSRCQRIPFSRLDRESMVEVLQKTGNEEILSLPQIMAIAQGSPGDAIASMQQLQAISPDLLEKLQHLPKSHRDALELARQIDKNLDTEAQLWLIDYLQHCYWQKFLQGEIEASPLEKLETTRRNLLAYAQPRLVWEVSLLSLISTVFA
ncbi:MAG TPA: DNA polymerase III subunit delta' [Cyanobacteria bacterium UBA11049]|nr:DNA polymerase III subunit delta' [Cyanobacteria bacterium UBA11049]